MRIAHVLRRLSFDDWGGTEQVVWNIAKAQKAAGHDVRLFATTALWKGKDDRRDWRDRRDGRLEVVDGIEILRFKPIYPWWPMPKRPRTRPRAPGMASRRDPLPRDGPHRRTLPEGCEAGVAVKPSNNQDGSLPAWRRWQRAGGGGEEPQGAD